MKLYNVSTEQPKRASMPSARRLLHFTFCILHLVFVLSSCSISKQISKSANILLKDSALIAGHVGISFYEPATGKTWFSHNSNKYFIPASNTKLFSLYAGLKYLPDSLPGIKYYESHGVTIIEPTGDPTFLHPDFVNQPVYSFLKTQKNIQLNLPSFNDYLGKGWAWDDYKESYMAQRSSMPMYGNVITITRYNKDSLAITPTIFKSRTLIQDSISPGFAVERFWDSNSLYLKKGSRLTAQVPFQPNESTIKWLLIDTLNTDVYNKHKPLIRNDVKIVYSQPADSMYRIMMHRSDNFFAEQTLLMAGNEKLGEMDDGKMISHILMQDLKGLLQIPKWVDGSGLSRYNLFTPESFIFILNKMRIDFGMDRMKSILPTGGTGTLENYYKSDSSLIYAKTGTLSNNLALSGYVITRKNKLLIFSILVNNFPSGPTPVRKAIEKFVHGIIAEY